jgi:hypothetical protein
MKICLRALLLALPFLAVPAPAHAEGGGMICFGFSCSKWNGCDGGNGCGGGTLAPWYTYWPYAAHFQTPALPCFPYWPSPMATTLSQPPMPPAVHPAAYYSPVGSYAQWPSYWYGH